MLKKIIAVIMSAFLLALAGCSEPEAPDDAEEGKTLTILAYKQDDTGHGKDHIL